MLMLRLPASSEDSASAFPSAPGERETQELLPICPLPDSPSVLPSPVFPEGLIKFYSPHYVPGKG